MDKVTESSSARHEAVMRIEAARKNLLDVARCALPASPGVLEDIARELTDALAYLEAA